ncbi:hypothetical protein [Burkholderia sp. BCC0419]|uniref:hypothetical protein n=1 Tax=Burkholderia sp. BCC0419 TaxID=486878 RepID=UPI00158F0F6E|nr:hypothetical protein [Burkholderia sp. BCC0419]
MRLNKILIAALTVINLLWSFCVSAELGGAPMLPPADDPVATARVIRSINGVSSGIGGYTFYDRTIYLGMDRTATGGSAPYVAF